MKNRLQENGNGATTATRGKASAITIEKPNLEFLTITIRGNAPYVQNKFPAKAKEEMRLKQEAGSTAKKGSKRKPKDFQECYQNAIHYSTDGWPGIPAPAFRNAMVSACKICGFHMTKAKLAVFIEADGFDKDDGTPLIKFTEGEPHYTEHYTRVQKTTDIRARAMWDAGWEAQVTIRYDADVFTSLDIVNLMARVGLQVGIGEGRPDSRDGCGMGWGTFDIVAD